MLPSTSTPMPLVPTAVIPKSRRLGRSSSSSRIDRPISTTHSATAVLSTTNASPTLMMATLKIVFAFR
ncbi:hypothetical protein BS47DRAFT_1348101 [Hydnum rufescens UP504]|uniref:Uncharacterized protein n=1 Tax=Hydnum rufescens UP504 TaxID=1448309 RepID=A0A9P6ARK2_9AGAM|nr:hypothetical protein BS47DRAFT_1348101 [Hydnum rufescens UP504]